MAAYNLNRTLHNTLTGTTVDTVALIGEVSWVEIVNRAGTTALYVTDDGSTPVADAAGTEIVQQGEVVTIEDPRTRTLKILGNGNTYDLAAGR